MPEAVAPHGAAAWPGAIGRIIAFFVLTALLWFVLGAGYVLLPRPRTETGMLLPAIVPAAAALIAGSFLIRRLDGRSPAALGIGVSRRTVGLSGLGLLIGMTGLALAAGVLLAAGTLAYQPDTGTAALWVGTVAAQAVAFGIAALAEEAIFRGYPFQVLVRAAGPLIAIVVSSFGFAWVHGRNPGVGPLALVNIFLAGVVFGLGYLRTLSLWFVTALHLGWNWTMASLLDLPVSGWEFDTPLYEPTVDEPAWFSGGEFGPEGGLVGTLGFALALIAVLRLRAVQPDPGVRAAGPLVVREATGNA
jgi:membrane protease YdiL (CAAX protease family)